MRNPFEELGRPRIVPGDWEVVEGAFSCQHGRCHNTVSEAKYLESEKLLSWICDNEHVNKIKDFHIE